MRLEAAMQHEEGHIGKFVGGRGIAYLEGREPLDNRTRAWEFLVGQDMCDAGSFLKKPSSKTFTYREVRTTPGTSPTPTTHATLDRVWCHTYHRRMLRDVNAKPRIGHF